MIPAVLILPKIARLALVKSTGLIAVLFVEISTLVKASVSVLFEAASKTSPVVAVFKPLSKRGATW
jgi:hypothetical protein